MLIKPRLSTHYQYVITIILALITLGPWLYNLFPVFRFYPDFEYVMAKVIRVLEGNIFADPVTGIQNFHPPVYHVILAPFHALGIPTDYLLWFVTIINIVVMYILVFKILKRLFDSNTAIITVAMLPFINEFMGCGNILLPTAFYTGVSTFLAGIWFYLSPNRTIRQTILFASFWGVTFLISPAYLFPIGFVMLFELLIARDFRQFWYACTTFLVFLIPFFYQAYVIFSNNLFGTSAFAFWRGFPDEEFLSTLVAYMVNPTSKAWSNPLIWAALVVSGVGLYSILSHLKNDSTRKIKWYLLFATLAYLLTFYNFKPQYAIRIHFFISIFISAFAVSYLFQILRNKLIVFAICLLFVIGGYIDHYMYYNFEYEKQNDTMKMFEPNFASLEKVFETRVGPNDYIFAHHLTYRHYIMPHFPAHALMAYRSGEYFQLTSRISKEMQVDYERFLDCASPECLHEICSKYDISIAIVNQNEFNQPVFRLIESNWQRVYSDRYFRIYQK